MKEKNESGITLVALVITIIILLILAGIVITFAIGNNGIIGKAQEAQRMQTVAQIREKMSLEVLDAESEAYVRGEKLKQEELKNIIAKYGELQEDGDTIKLKEVDANLSLKEIYNGEIQKLGDVITQSSPIKLSAGPFRMGTNTSVHTTDVNVLTLNNLEGYNKCTIAFSGDMGTYISARIYIDDNLVETISDASEHEIELNNNSKMVINLYSYNLSNGDAGISNLELE